MLAHSIQTDIPDRLVTYVGEEEEIELPAIYNTEDTVTALSVKNQSSGFSMKSKQTGSYQVPVRLFGIVPIKNVDVKVIRKMKLAPSGEPIGIYVDRKSVV